MPKSSALQILCKWRQAYTMLATSGPIGFERYVRDATDSKLLHRIELSALANLLVQKGVFTLTEFIAQVEVEAEVLTKRQEKGFPGFSFNADGLVLKKPEAYHTMQRWQEPYGVGGPRKE